MLPASFDVLQDGSELKKRGETAVDCLDVCLLLLMSLLQLFSSFFYCRNCSYVDSRESPKECSSCGQVN